MKEYEKIQGQVDSLIFKNEDTGFCVLMLDYEGDPLCVVGDMGDVEEGEELTLTGEFTSHPRYGEQFKVKAFERSLPTDSAAIFKYLASGAVSEIGAVTARKLVNKFGDRTLEIIEKEPERLTEIRGITEKKAKKINEEFMAGFAMRTLVAYLDSFEIPTAVSIRAWKRWGDSARSSIMHNPYILCREGLDLSFAKADEIAAREQLPFDSSQRVAAGISCVLKEFADSGNTCVPEEVLRSRTAELLGIGEGIYSTTLTDLLEDEELFCYPMDGKDYIMLRCYYKAEDYIARRLDIMKGITYDNNIDFSPVIDLEEEESGIHYEELQRKAINKALSEGFLILTGGPGTGKTTTLNAMISLFGQQGLNVMIAAPTGRAAKRISELTGCEAKTIHRLLEVKFGSDDTLSFVHDENDLLDCDVLVVDEMSMVDSCLFEALLRAISVTCKLVLVGDSDQLPSVGPGNVLRDIIDSGVMSVIELKEIFRQAQESDIVVNAHRIVRGELIDLKKKDKDFFFLQRLRYREIQDLVGDLYKERLPRAYGFSPMENIQVLSPSRKGPVGTNELNRILQERLNPLKSGQSEVKILGCSFRVGDKVMQTRNNYDIEWSRTDSSGKTEKGTGVFNGDIGVVTKANSVLRSLTVDFDGRTAVISGEMLSDLELAYAVTVHKSQGSEFDAVILTVFWGYDRLYYRNLLYTAVTRAKKLLIIVGSGARLEFMIKNDRRSERWTALKSMLLKETGMELKGE